jgi:AcrR family transcriptional regulator
VPHTPRAITRQPPRTPQPGPRSKRDQILDVATDYFGRYGYDETKWADVAAAVGIGPTALYHYFESKQHCLYEIMSRAVVRTRERFDHIVAANTDWRTALVELLESGFDLAPKDMHEYRVLLSQHDRLEARRSAPREEAARTSVRARKRELEAAWAAFLARGIEEGQLPRSDPQLLARALLGLYNSVWTWYRPRGALSIEEVGRFFVGRELALLGCD